MIVPLKNAKTYGVLHTENYFSFLGFSKKVNSDEVQKVDVYLDNELIDTIIANKHLQKIEDIYELEGFGFEYILPNEYIGKKNVISFKNHKTQENLQNSPYKLITENHPEFNEMAFLNSLKMPIDKEEITKIYCSNSIGFLATEENLEDEEFIQYIKELMNRFQDIRIKGFYFNNSQKDLLKKIFLKEPNVEHIEIRNIYQISEKSRIYITHYKARIDTDISIKLRMNFSNIFCWNTNLEYYNYKNITIKEFENLLEKPFAVFMKYAKQNGFLENEISKDGNYVETLNNAIFKRFYLGEEFINEYSLACEYFNFEMIKYALKNDNFIEFYSQLTKKQLSNLRENIK